jgi:hypothetical protein
VTDTLLWGGGEKVLHFVRWFSEFVLSSFSYECPDENKEREKEKRKKLGRY